MDERMESDGVIPVRPSLACALVALAAIWLAACPLAVCQGAPPGPIHTDPNAPPEQIPERPKNTIRVQANEVVAPVTVTDKNGEMILNLKQRDFHVFEDGVEQPVEHFGLGGQPLSIVLVVETSKRVEPLKPAVQKSGIIFAQPVIGQTAEAAIVEYDDSVRVLERFTTDPESLQGTINHLETGGAGARLYDAMQRGISLLEERPEGQRRILLVVGESTDTGSESTLGQVLRRAQIANVTIYSVGLSTTAAMWKSKPEDRPAQLPPLPTGDQRQDEVNREMQNGGANLMDMALWLLQTGKNAIGANSLAVASQSTGGLHIGTMKDRAIQNAMDAIGGELHAQYTIGYTPSPDQRGGYHEIKVTVDKAGVNVRTRPGYYLADAGS
jgi:VWFA-related protein